LYVKGSDGSFQIYDEDATTERLVIDTSGNVGIGTAAPSKTLEVHSTSGSAGIPNGLYLYNTIHGSNSQIYMYAENDAGSLKSSTISLDPDSTNLTISGAGGGNNLVIDSSGNVGIGTDDPNKTGYSTNAKVLTVADYGSAGDYGAIEIAGYRTNAGLIGELGFNNLDSSGNNTSQAIVRGLWEAADGIGLQFWTEATGAAASAKMTILGSGNVTFTGDLIMADGKGIDFAAYTDGSVAGSTTSQILKDYEEGTWTAVCKLGGSTISNYATTSRYTKIGRVVYVSTYLAITGAPGQTGALTITGLPFTVGAASNYHCFTIDANGVPAPDDPEDVWSSGYFLAGATSMNPRNRIGESVDDTDIDNSCDIVFTGFYQID